MTTSLPIILLVLCALTTNAKDSIMVTQIERLNAGKDDYAIAYRSGKGIHEIWSTSAVTRNDLTTRRLFVLRPADTLQTAPQLLTLPPFSDSTANYIGVPAFNPCDPNEMLFVSDRRIAGRRASNDIYHAVWNGAAWTATPLSVNTDQWDDTPSFGRTGSVLYFSSDRRRPGSGRADLFLSRRTATGWSEPELLRSICTEIAHEVSPCVGPDGRLYFAADTRGDLDIWSVALDSTGMPYGSPMEVTMPGVNRAGSNELHPVFSPDGSAFAFSSDRGERRSPYRIYQVQGPECEIGIDLTVVAKTRRRDVQLERMFGSMDSISYVSTSIIIHDRTTRLTDTIRTDAEGKGRYVIHREMQNGILMGERLRTLEITAIPHTTSYAGTTDTVLISVLECGRQIQHQVFLHDTTVQRDSCEFVFRTFNVPFFITTYWCPTTRKYRDYLPCTSLFTDDVGCDELQQPVPCASNEAYQYEFTPARIRRVARKEENCVRYDEFEKNGPQWAAQVDAAIERMRDEVAAVFNESCVQEAIRRKMPLTVEMFGTTDDRTINYKCQYTGKAYDELRGYLGTIRMADEIKPFIKPGQHFNNGGYGGRAGGNQLLSDLRSAYFSIMFDRLCQETIPVYRRLRQDGQIDVLSRGQAIDQRDIPFEYKRAAGVKISVPNFTIVSEALRSPTGRTVSYCKDPCGCE